MATALESYEDYAQLVFSLLTNRPTVERHTMTVYMVSRTLGISRGQVFFRSGHVLHVFEQIDFIAHRIIRYFYELTYGDETLWWYDSMPHPDTPELQSTHPHHKHVPPDIKRHRIPAPEISFTMPNIPHLLAQIEANYE